MKKIILLLMLFITTKATARFSQVIYISPTGTNITKNNEYYQFENEDVRIVYSFWAENGIMGFMIYNKTDKPIYIDWKKSSMIYNGNQNPYYTNKTISNYTAYGSSYGSSWATIFNSYAFEFGSSNSHVNAQETIVKAERTTFIPPHSYISKAFYNILNNIVFSLDRKESEETKIYGYPVYVTTPHNPIAFRNFVTYSATEDFAIEKYVDNEFYISKIVTMRNDYFGSKDVEGHYTNEWQKPTRLYISDIKRSDVFE